jgi:CRP-like cAMP-binding protein
MALIFDRRSVIAERGEPIARLYIVREGREGVTRNEVS